jgi:hypothetical protein
VTASTKITAALKKYGRQMLLRRRIGTTSSYQDVTVTGITKGYRPAELMGGLQQGDRYVRISNAEIAAQGVYIGPPRKGDFVVIDGASTAVQGVETERLSAEVLIHTLWVRG